MGKIPSVYSETGRKWRAKSAKNLSDSLRSCYPSQFPKLKNLTRTKKGEGIIKRAEKQLLNERIRNINYKIEKFEHDKYMYENQLREILKEDHIMWNACKEEVLKRREIRHLNVQKRQIKKIERLIKG